MIPTIETPDASDGNGHKALGDVPGNGVHETQNHQVRPVKARVGNGQAPHGIPNGHGVDGAGLHTADYEVGRTRTTHVPYDVAQVSQQTTSHLRDSDLIGLRLRLKREEWAQTHGSPRDVHQRSLPYFLMRRRMMRARSGVGYTRSQAAKNRFGAGGPGAVVIRVVLAVTLFTGLVMSAGIGGVAAGGAWYVENMLPPVTEIHGLQVQTTKILDRNGTLLYDIVDEGTGRRQELTSLDQISPYVISATIAVEDANFYTNPGVDPASIVRAITINFGGKGQSGASTITQQLVRQVNLPEGNVQTFSRKIREMIQSLRFTRYYSKDEILLMYLNQNFYGHRAYGIEAAALTYFGKHAKELTLNESALLAGLPQAPTEYDPVVNSEIAAKRKAIVLDLMAKQGYISNAEANTAKGALLYLRPYTPDIEAPHFVYYVKEYLEKMYGPDVSERGLVVTTTLDLDVQKAAEKVARDRIDELKRQKATNAAIVVMKPGTGEILAMVGSVDYNNTAIDGQVNVATRERQPGSSFKPITYATAFKNGWTPGTVVLDTLTSFPNPGQKPYVPNNYDGRDHGWVTVREALGNSYNIPAVKAVQFAGVQNVIDTAHDLGIQGLNRGVGWYGLSLTLGGGEVTLLDMVNAYSTFANGGSEVDANPILKIQDPQGRIINQLDPNARSHGNQALDPRYAYMITSILSDNRARSSAFGPNSPLKLNYAAAVKTGTTDDNRDSWTLGYTPNLTVGVWVGNSNNAEMLKVTGAIGAAVIWHNMMDTFYNKPEFVDLVRQPDGLLQDNFVQPDGLIKTWACSSKGDINDLFLKEAPPKGCSTYKDTNKQLHGIPSGTPGAKPTPIPGIILPTPQP